MTSLQLDLLTDTTDLIAVRGGREIETRGGAWRAKWIGRRFGWILFRRATGGWETWEPDLPYGQPHILDRDEVERILLEEVAEHGDYPLFL